MRADGPTGATTESIAAEDSALCDPARLHALELAGLGAEADPEMERFAEWVRRALAVPTALVSLVHTDEQVFPGMVGLPEPFAAARATPLTHSFCRHVVDAAEPLIVTDARTDPLVRENLAIPDLGVIAYAGIPLTDEQGHVLGSLCAIDGHPREWTDDEIATLHDIARSCSTELRLRLARYDAGVEGGRRDRTEHLQRRVHRRRRVLLSASQAFAATMTVPEVRVGVGEVLHSELQPIYAEAVLHDRPGRPQRFPIGPGAAGGLGPSHPRNVASTHARLPSVTAIREQRLVHHPDRAAFDAEYPAEVAALARDLGVHTVVAVPIPGVDVPIGAIVLGWDRPDAVDDADLLLISTVAGYAGQAIVRARTLQHRVSVAHEMQNAMLTVLPVVPGLAMAARYAPADSRLNVGGDWYDAAPVVDPDDADHPDAPIVAVSVGDIIGHDLPAVTIMGQVRSMLRQAAWDHPGGPPSVVFGAFEHANRGLALGAAGTAVVAHLHRSSDEHWLLRWTNAGHPPPILLLPDGTTELLDEHGPLFGFRLTEGTARTDHERVIAPGTTIFLYTDGLIERPGTDIDAGTDALLTVLGDVRHGTPTEVVEAAMHTLPEGAHDDVVAFAIRIGPEAPV